ncbi:MAG: efflux transporter outer membrane subunit [Acidobacteriaceae bacterium]|nr:efflux transporter outer membrane subunit [Acidobacteriaceae bacterium]
MQPTTRVTRHTLALAFSTLALTGCLGPKYTRPTVQAPPAFRGADDAAVATEAANSLGDQKWTEVFQQPELQELIKTALANNYDLRIAAQRVLEYQSQVKIARAAQFPSLSAGGTGAGADLPSSVGSSIANPLVIGSFNLQASWTPDFWGLYRKQTQAAREDLLAQTWAQRAVRVTLVQQVVTGYLQLRMLDEQLKIATDTAGIRKDSLDLTRKLESAGSSPLSDVRQAEQLYYTATEQIPVLEEQIQQNENAMRLLLGQTPGTVVHTAPDALAPPPQALPTGIPSQLLERRPDIQQAEANLRAANARVGVARAAFFPSLAISGSAGLGGDTFPNIFSSDSKTIYGLGNLTQPIFAGGQIRGKYDLSKQQKEELVLTYQKTILGAFRDVSNALIAVNKSKAAREQQERLVSAARDATRLAQMRYKAGSTSYLEVLTVSSNEFSAELQLATLQETEALTLVQLYAALGGGWQ